MVMKTTLLRQPGLQDIGAPLTFLRGFSKESCIAVRLKSASEFTAGASHLANWCWLSQLCCFGQEEGSRGLTLLLPTLLL